MNEQEEKRVLALKYRPRKFEDLVGQTTISQTLSLALNSNRISHAYLFSGLRGSGKTSTARIMAKALLCSQGPTSKPCETCDNCISANASKHLDIIEMDAASNRGIDDIKDLIEHTKYKPSSARFKVFIIDEVHMLTTQAFNALLKTLEEPPSFVKFILATTDPLKLPATILSRTQHFRFNKISNYDVVHHLSHILNEENIDFEKEALEILSRTGQGSLRDTLTLLDQAIIFSKGKITAFSVIDMLGLIDPQIMDDIFSIILERKEIISIIKKLEIYEVSQICDEMTIYLKNKMIEKNPKFDILLFDRFFRILSDAKHLLALNSDSSFVLILTFLKMIEATKLKTIDEIINQVEEIKIQEKPKIQEEKDILTIKEEKQTTTNQVINTSKIEETPKNSFSTPFDNFVVEEEIKEKQEEDIKETIIEKTPMEDVLFKKVVEKVYDRDYDLGECFEKNFIFNGLENNKLQILSYAQGEDRKFLYKYFALIRGFIQDIYGEEVQLDFIKKELSKQKDEKKKSKENIDINSGCVANMHSSTNPTLSQRELDLDEIINSKMLDKAKELFDIKKITVKTRS